MWQRNSAINEAERAIRLEKARERRETAGMFGQDHRWETEPERPEYTTVSPDRPLKRYPTYDSTSDQRARQRQRVEEHQNDLRAVEEEEDYVDLDFSNE
jgi:hypothetical protein